MAKKKSESRAAQAIEADALSITAAEDLLAVGSIPGTRSYALSAEEDRALRWRAQNRIQPGRDAGTLDGDDDGHPAITEDDAARIEFESLVASTLAGVVINHREHLGREIGPAFHSADEATQAKVRKLLGA